MPFPTTEECVAAAESALGATLPGAWRSRLLRDNGGEVELAEDVWRIFPVQDTTDRKRAGRTAGHIVIETRSAREWAGFPETAIAIAANDSGDFLILLVEKAGSDAGDLVYRWNHETREALPIGPSRSLD
jgi:SMI1 / KNR4 family (SUKH-1)